MTLRTSLGCVGLLVGCSFVFVGCGDDEPAGDGGSDTGGKGGTSGKGGSSGKGGTSGTSGAAGKGGMAGKGGAAGKGGTAGSAGSAGQDMGGAGADGGVGGEGAEGGASGAGAGAGGAGAGGEGGVPDTTADSCNYVCVDDTDCASGVNTAYKCHPTRKRCENPDLVCASHNDCIAMASFWTTVCVDDTWCTPGLEVCIDVGGRGRCAATPFPKLGCFTGAERTMTKFGSTGTEAVCASDTGRCDDQNRCFIGCTDSPTFCATRGRGPNCNATTGLCECDADAQCTAAGVSMHCNMTTHQCECTSNTACTGSGADQCVSGRCGCSSSIACSTTVFANATPVCE